MELKCQLLTTGEFNASGWNWFNEPFFFKVVQGVVLINREMPQIDRIMEAVRACWQYDLLDVEAEELFARECKAVRYLAGEVAKDQFCEAWSKAATISRKAKAEKKAAEWIEKVYDKLDDEDWEEICNAGYDSEFVGHGLFRVFSDLQTKHPNSPKYKDYFGNARNAAFVYGFLLGKAAV